MSPLILAWLGVGVVVIRALLDILKPEFPLPITLAPAARALVALVLGAVMAGLQSVIGGTPIVTAAMTALGAVVTAFMTHGMLSDKPSASSKPPSVGPAVMCLFVLTLACGAIGCQGFLKGHEAQIVDGLKLGLCIDAEIESGERRPLVILSNCKQEAFDEAISLVTVKLDYSDARANAARSAACK